MASAVGDSTFPELEAVGFCCVGVADAVVFSFGEAVGVVLVVFVGAGVVLRDEVEVAEGVEEPTLFDCSGEELLTFPVHPVRTKSAPMKTVDAVFLCIVYDSFV